MEQQGDLIADYFLIHAGLVNERHKGALTESGKRVDDWAKYYRVLLDFITFPRSRSLCQLAVSRMSSGEKEVRRWVAWVDAVLAVLFFCVGVIWIWTAQVDAEATRVNGIGRDIYAYAIWGAMVYFPPGCILFSLASWAGFRKARFSRILHYLAIAWAAFPFVLVALN